MTASALAIANQKQIADLAIKNRLAGDIRSGDLCRQRRLDVLRSRPRLKSTGASPFLIDKILKGTKPAEIPVEQPMKFEFIINLKAAKQIGLTIPPNVLVRAGKVIR